MQFIIKLQKFTFLFLYLENFTEMIWLHVGFTHVATWELSTFFWCRWKVSQELSENVPEWHTVHHPPLSSCPRVWESLAVGVLLLAEECRLGCAGWSPQCCAHCSGITWPLGPTFSSRQSARPELTSPTQTHRHTMTIICKSHFTNDPLASSDQHTTQLFADTGGNVDFSQV